MKKFDNYRKNLDVLRRSDQQDLNNEFIISGIIDKFSIQFELGWKVLKELLKYEGKSIASVGSPRDIIKAAFTIYDFIDEDVWLGMLKSRNDMTHIYDGAAAKNLVYVILKQYIPAFIKLRDGIAAKYGEDLEL